MKYELITILTLQTEQDLALTVGKIEEMIKQAGGAPSTGRLMSRGKLVYPVRHERQGIHYAIPFESSHETLKTMEKSLKLVQGLLRVMVTKDEGIAALTAQAKAAPARGWAKKEEPATPAAEIQSAPAETPVAPPVEEKKTLQDLDKQLSDILKESV
ncbi:MAG: 30S ribosomal protein S6 [Patescibacteria group bacterium]